MDWWQECPGQHGHTVYRSPCSIGQDPAAGGTSQYCLESATTACRDLVLKLQAGNPVARHESPRAAREHLDSGSPPAITFPSAQTSRKTCCGRSVRLQSTTESTAAAAVRCAWGMMMEAARPDLMLRSDHRTSPELTVSVMARSNSARTDHRRKSSWARRASVTQRFDAASIRRSGRAPLPVHRHVGKDAFPGIECGWSFGQPAAVPAQKSSRLRHFRQQRCQGQGPQHRSHSVITAADRRPRTGEQAKSCRSHRLAPLRELFKLAAVPAAPRSTHDQKQAAVLQCRPPVWPAMVFGRPARHL